MTCQPTCQPTAQPRSKPSKSPRKLPSSQPSNQPQSQPSKSPTRQPLQDPSSRPTHHPSYQPRQTPTRQPSHRPYPIPSKQPYFLPSSQPVNIHPSSAPSTQPSKSPRYRPSSQPSLQPTAQFSTYPTLQPHCRPTRQPNTVPTKQPFHSPSAQPTIHPNVKPTSTPTKQPNRKPTRTPSKQPTYQPRLYPTSQPFQSPSVKPTSFPTRPSSKPSSQPIKYPRCQPTKQPSIQPIVLPTKKPSIIPSIQPTKQPNSRPSDQPTVRPINNPPIPLRPTLFSTSLLVFGGYQVISNCSYESYIRDSFAERTFMKSIAEVCRIDEGNVRLISAAPVSRITNNNQRHLLSKNVSSLIGNNGINITYSIRIPLNTSNATQSLVFGLVQGRLVTSVRSGNLTTVLQANAVALKSFSLKKSIASTTQYRISSYYTIDRYAASPTASPGSLRQPLQPISNKTVIAKTIEQWNHKNGAILKSGLLSQDSTHRILYDAVTVNNAVLLGGCTPWLSFCASLRSLTSPPLSSQHALSVLTFVVVLNLSSAVLSSSCSDASEVNRIAQLLCSSDPAPSTVTATAACANHNWKVAQCAVGKTVQRVACVDCSNPCTSNRQGFLFWNPCIAANSTIREQNRIEIIEMVFSSSESNGGSYWVMSYAFVTAAILVAAVLVGNKSLSIKSRRKIVSAAEQPPIPLSGTLPSSSLFLMLKPTLGQH
eukprot:gene37957-49754_t